jgi:hypothetical protein
VSIFQLYYFVFLFLFFFFFLFSSSSFIMAGATRLPTGVFPTMITPFEPSGAVDWARLDGSGATWVFCSAHWLD